MAATWQRGAKVRCCPYLAVMGLELKAVRAFWRSMREVYLSLGLDDGVARLDALFADEARALREPDSWEYDWRKALAELGETVGPEGGIVPVTQLIAAYNAMVQVGRKHLADAERLIVTRRGQEYVTFLLWAQIKLKDGMLSTGGAFVPDSVRPALGPEHDEARSGQSVEVRVRRLADAIHTTTEAYYRPLLKMVWTLSAQIVGHRHASPPSEVGALLSKIRDQWKHVPPERRIDEFLDDEATEVRNGVAHKPVGFDPKTDELIVTNRDGTKTRFTEAELLRRFGNLFERARTMHMCFYLATGQLEERLAPLDVERG